MLEGPNAPADLLDLFRREQQDGSLVAISGGYDSRWETYALMIARERGTALLSVRATSPEILIGPLWSPDGDSGCAGCAQIRDTDRRSTNHTHARPRPAVTPAEGLPALPPHTSGPAPAILPPALSQLLAELLDRARLQLAPGELLSLAPDGTLRRHRVPRSFRCAVCGGGPDLRAGRPAEPPRPRVLASRPTTAAIPVRGEPPFGLDPDRMRGALADPRFGPVIRMQRHGLAGMAMAETSLLGARFAGHGRGMTFRHAEAVGCLEAFERSGGYPHVAPVVFNTTARRLGDRALDLPGLGHCTAQQMASPLSRLMPFDDDTPMDWVWGHQLGSGQPLLVPAELGFYQYGYSAPSEAPEDARRTHFFNESSSGSALGGSYEEATLHSLFELAERDAFLLSWHRGRPLPRIAPTEISDRECLLLIRQIEHLGYDVHLLAATVDLAVPVVWVLAMRRDGRMPASFNSAGSGADPVQAAKSALWEVSQQVTFGLNWDVEALRPAVSDPWLVDELLDHQRRYAYPELLPRIEAMLGGPPVGLAEAFPGWPGDFTSAAQGDVTEALRLVAELFREAGLDRIVVVDQSTPEHTAAGLSSVKAVVPGIVPMCFGQANQRLAGLPRLVHTLADAHGTPPRDEDFPFDPHPFP
ncbi:TOMM precursor leader peptide-binding protein [Streptacidiphilus sp. EB129]|uniref:TOMM precursor leader peptide-binding protein n=1 Tax=Streptacidiphilus sp. EB129 TaxID=3156262 RepID=UPI0035180013